MAIICAFGNQKGGVGKTTLTNQFANFIHFSTHYKVIVIDGDYLQASLASIREFELKRCVKYFEEEQLNNGFQITTDQKKNIETEFLKKCYKLITIPIFNIANAIDNIDENRYDFIIIDLPGAVFNEDIISIYYLFDYVFVPMDVTFKDMDSTKRFLEMYDSNVRRYREKKQLQCNVWGVFNKLKAGTIEYKQRYQNVLEMGINIPFINTVITDTNQLKREDSTVEILRLDGIKNTYMIDNFCKEVMDIILKNKN